MIILHRALGWVRPMGGVGGLTKMWGWTKLGPRRRSLNLRNAPYFGALPYTSCKSFCEEGAGFQYLVIDRRILGRLVIGTFFSLLPWLVFLGNKICHCVMIYTSLA